MFKRLMTYALALSLIFSQPMTSQAEEVVVVGSDTEKAYTDVQVTCYMEPGKPTYTGSYRTDGSTAASKVEWVGYCAYLYKINEDGSLGDFIDIVEFNDIGYGAPIGHGTKSEMKQYKGKSAGSIETGKTIDIRLSNMSACKDFMKATYTGNGTTGSQVYMVLVDGEG